MIRLCLPTTLTVCSLLLSLNQIYAHPASIDTTTFVTNQILSAPTDTSMIIRVIPKKVVQLYFEYGTAPPVFSNQTTTVTSTANVPVRFVLRNLLPNTRYYYRLRYKETGATSFIVGDQCSFVTQRVKGSTYRFALTSDSHLYDKKGIPSVMKVTMQNILNDSTDFLIDLGDTFGDDHTPTTTSQQEMMQLHLNFMWYLGMVCHSAPFFFCLGNHEGESGYYLLQTPPNNIGVYGTVARKYYYSNPSPNGFYTGNISVENFGIGQPENYYAWEWGDALFVVFDAYRGYTASAKPRGWEWTLGKEQYDWLKATLESSKAKYKFVFAHHTLGETRGGAITANLHEWGGYESNGQTWGFTTNRPGWAMPIHQLMAKNGVNIYFQGHDHLFAKENVGAVVYQEIPMPSDSSYMIGMLANADAYLSNQVDGSGHLRVTVSVDSVFVEYVGAYLPKDEDATHKNRQTRFSYSVKNTPTAIADDTPVPSNFKLEQNYPNPFNPSTSIRYSIPTSGFVSLTVNDILGRNVARLVDQEQPAGMHDVPFNATNLPSGVYFYQLNWSGRTVSHKALLMK